MNWGQLLLRMVLVSAVTPYGITACVRSPRCESRAAPDFASLVTSSFLLDMLKQMSGLPTLEAVPPGAVPSGAANTKGYAFALPGSGSLEGESYVVTINYSAGRPSSTGAGCPEVGGDAGGGLSCMNDLQQLPFSVGPGGSYRAVKFTTIDLDYAVQIAVFEKLKDTTVNQPLELNRIAALIGKKYCAEGGARLAGAYRRFSSAP